jgi:hypothetical protein
VSVETSDSAGLVDRAAALAQPTGQRLLVDPALLAEIIGDDVVTMVHTTAASMASGLVSGYIRDRGLPPVGQVIPGDLGAVAQSVALRLVLNLPQWRSQSDTTTVENTATTVSRDGGFVGFTLTEQLLLDRYRQRTA